MRTFGLDDMMRAARDAREQSTGGKVIWIAVTDEGFVVQGTRLAFAAAIDVPWPEIDANPGRLSNAIQLVARRLGD